MSSQAKVDSLQSSNLPRFVSSGVSCTAEKILQSTTQNRSLYVTLAGFLFGAGTQLLFVWTVGQLFLFLRYGGH